MERIPPIIVNPTNWTTGVPVVILSFTQDKVTAKFGQIKLQTDLPTILAGDMNATMQDTLFETA